MDPAEWPEMREYVSPAELDAYGDLYKAAVRAEAAKNGGGSGRADPDVLPPAPPRTTLSLDDLERAAAARKQGQQGDPPPFPRPISSFLSAVSPCARRPFLPGSPRNPGVRGPALAARRRHRPRATLA